MTNPPRRTLAAAALTVLLLAGCGASGGDAAEEPAAPMSTTEASTTSAPEPVVPSDLEGRGDEIAEILEDAADDVLEVTTACRIDEASIDCILGRGTGIMIAAKDLEIARGIMDQYAPDPLPAELEEMRTDIGTVVELRDELVDCNAAGRACQETRDELIGAIFHVTDVRDRWRELD